MGKIIIVDGDRIDEETGENYGPVDHMMTLEGMEPDDFFEGVGGTQTALSFDLGSNLSVAQSTLKMKPVPELPVKGQYNDGDIVQFIVTVKVNEVQFKPIIDKHGVELAKRRHHIAMVERVDELTTDDNK